MLQFESPYCKLVAKMMKFYLYIFFSKIHNSRGHIVVFVAEKSKT